VRSLSSTALPTRIAPRLALVAGLLATLAVAALVWGATVAAAATLSPPATIKVARRAGNDPQGRIYRVDTVDFRTYCVRVLSHEWAPATSFSSEALKAGALAVKDYGWYWATRTTKLSDVRAAGADVDDSVNYQVYMDSDYGPRYWAAVDAVWGTAMTRGGSIFQASYRAGTYTGAANGWYMSQWGTEYWADQGQTFDWICRHYYPNIDFTPVAGVPVAGDTSVDEPASDGLTPLAADPSLQGPARLELIGPVLAAPERPALGQRVTLTFTLHNAGAKAGTWDELTVVARGPGDEARDFGTVTDLKLEAGEYRLFEARRVVDLQGVWRGWMVTSRDGKLGLVGDGAPFELQVRRTVAGDGAGSAADAPVDSPSFVPHVAPEGRRKTAESRQAETLIDTVAGTFGL
jgi:hypothetical protein